MEYYYKIRLIYYTDKNFDTEVSRDNFYGTLYIQNHWFLGVTLWLHKEYIFW